MGLSCSADVDHRSEQNNYNDKERTISFSLQNMERSAEPVTPLGVLFRLREIFPQFAQQHPPNSGNYMQQDAEECWTQVLYTIKEVVQVSKLAGLPC